MTESLKQNKQNEWLETSKAAGYEGAGVIFYYNSENTTYFVLGINKKNEAEYVGGKVEKEDKDVIDTVQREIKEETGLYIREFRLHQRFKITGGTTGCPSFLFCVQITDAEFLDMKSEDGTFTKFIKTTNMFGSLETPKLVDSNGDVYDIRKFNYKYVYPQIKEEFENYFKPTFIRQVSILDSKIPIEFFGVIGAIAIIWLFRKYF